MIELANGNNDIKDIQFLYKNYTDNIISLTKHVEKIYKNWIININTRNNVLQRLDILIREMMKMYNSSLSLVKLDKQSCLDIKMPQLVNNSFIHRDFYNRLMREVYMIENKQMKKCYDPFIQTKYQLIKLAKKYGFKSIINFLNMYIGKHYMTYLNNNVIELLSLYTKVFVPLNIKITNINNKPCKFKIIKSKSFCDSLVNNTCTIILIIKNKRIKLNGYIETDVLNTYVRTSQIYSKHLFKIKREVKGILDISGSQIDTQFSNKYIKTIPSSGYFILTASEFANKLIESNKYYNTLCGKNLNTIMREFVNSDIENMVNVIFILLNGKENHISIAGLLFNLLKEKKISGENLSNIIYNNLSFYSQLKLIKISTTIKNEIQRLKTLNIENISIEKKLSILPSMPDNVKKYIIEKINEIQSGENSYKLQNAINGLIGFPWRQVTGETDYDNIKKSFIKSRTFIQGVAKKIHETIYGHENSKQVLLELIGKWIQNPQANGQVIGLVGPPGVGKTLLAKSISSALSLPLVIIGLGGMNDAADLVGHSFTYAGAQYGMIIRQMIKAKNWRCIMFFDELDKVAKKNDTNEIYNTLIHITDPNMNTHFQDRFYSSSINFDLSGVLFVFSYNSSDKIDPILLDRIKEIKISQYSTHEKIEISKNYMLNEICGSIGLARDKIYFSDEIIKYIIEHYTAEAGVRELKRKLEEIVLKLNIDRIYMHGPFKTIMKKYAESKHIGSIKTDIDDLTEEKTGLIPYINYTKSKLEEKLDINDLNKIFNLEIDENIQITEKLIHKYLEKPTPIVDEIYKDNFIGVINGLYATSHGVGGIIPIQIYRNFVDETKEMNLKITGNQKKIMKESVVCALTTAINVLNPTIKKTISNNFPYGFHIHAPDGGTPKDGPSAGCAFTTAFISIFLNVKINRLVAMTGEIELTGKIKKIGGLDTKLYGAKKAGVRRVYICGENKDDYEKIKKKHNDLFDDTFEVKIVNHIIDIVTDPYVLIDIKKSDFDEEIIKTFLTK